MKLKREVGSSVWLVRGTGGPRTITPITITKVLNSCVECNGVD